MEEKLTYEERNAKTIQDKNKFYVELQEKLKKEVLNFHGFEVYICDPELVKINTDRGFFTSAYITFKGISFGHIVPSFKEDYKGIHGIEHLVLVRGAHDHIQTINYSIEEGHYKGEKITIKREHGSIQSCINELEYLRQEVVKFYSI